MLRRKTTDTTPSLPAMLTTTPRAAITTTPPALPTPTSQLVPPPPELPTTLTYTSEPLANPPAPTAYMLILSTGETITITGTGVIGRHPDTDPNYTHRITIPDPDKLLSRTHLTFPHHHRTTLGMRPHISQRNLPQRRNTHPRTTNRPHH